LRVVLDTNVLISAFVFPGGPHEAALRAGLEGRIEMVTSPVLLAEFARVLSSKFGWESSRVEAAVLQISRSSMIVRPTAGLAVIADDPDDDRVLEAALEARADSIVSGERHLLEVGEWRGISIVRAAEFIGRFLAQHE
jgi:uncharacterized protein